MNSVYQISEHYPKDIVNDEQNPISKIDVDIIQLIITAAYNGGVEELADILSSYKTLATDDQIKDDLHELCSRGEQVDDSRVNKHMLDINGTYIDVRFISVISKHNYYDDDKERMRYAITVNYDPNEKLFHANTSIDCGTQDNRDKILESLKHKLTKYAKIKFI